jgi:hypothetical protein
VIEDFDARHKARQKRYWTDEDIGRVDPCGPPPERHRQGPCEESDVVEFLAPAGCAERHALNANPRVHWESESVGASKGADAQKPHLPAVVCQDSRTVLEGRQCGGVGVLHVQHASAALRTRAGTWSRACQGALTATARFVRTANPLHGRRLPGPTDPQK